MATYYRSLQPLPAPPPLPLPRCRKAAKPNCCSAALLLCLLPALSAKYRRGQPAYLRACLPRPRGQAEMLLLGAAAPSFCRADRPRPPSISPFAAAAVVRRPPFLRLRNPGTALERRRPGLLRSPLG